MTDSPRNTPIVLECRGLQKRFGAFQAVQSVSFEIAEGETYGLLGPNGAGKTTTIAMICGLLERDAGDVLVAGRPVSPRTVAARGAIGYVPQDLAVYPDLTARENLRFFARLYGLGGGVARRRVDEVLELIGLADRASDAAKTYSGGMKRRLNIGIGLLHNPKLLVLDEPTVGVDPQSRNAILDGVEALSREGLAVLYTTHYMEEAERLCDRVGIIDAGVLVAEGTRRDLVARVGEHDRVELAGSGDTAAAANACTETTGVNRATVIDNGLDLLVDDARAILPELLRRCDAAGMLITSVLVREPDLESVFLHLTGKALRD